MTEEEVYQGSKHYLLNNGFILLAGQPPRGVDHLPVIEIKENNAEKGSKFAYKPDQVAYKDGYFIIIECKPSFDYDDYLKLKSVINSPIRVRNFYTELQQYHLLEKAGFTESFDFFCSHLKISLAYSGEQNRKYSDINHIIVRNWQGDASSTLI